MNTAQSPFTWPASRNPPCGTVASVRVAPVVRLRSRIVAAFAPDAVDRFWRWNRSQSPETVGSSSMFGVFTPAGGARRCFVCRSNIMMLDLAP